MKYLILIFVLFFNTAVYAEEAIIIVEAQDFRSSNGAVKVLLFNQKKGFPNNKDLSYKAKSCAIQDGKGYLIFENIPYGKYAISLFHDENDNEKLDTSFLGIPREGVGMSNNPKTKFGPPKFDSAQFEVMSTTITINIKVKYI